MKAEKNYFFVKQLDIKIDELSYQVRFIKK